MPTIFIEGDNHALKDENILYQFMIDHPNDKIGIEEAFSRVEYEIESLVLPSNTFGFENKDAYSSIMSMSEDSMISKNMHEFQY